MYPPASHGKPPSSASFKRWMYVASNLSSSVASSSQPISVSLAKKSPSCRAISSVSQSLVFGLTRTTSPSYCKRLTMVRRDSSIALIVSSAFLSAALSLFTLVPASLTRCQRQRTRRQEWPWWVPSPARRRPDVSPQSNVEQMHRAYPRRCQAPRLRPPSASLRFGRQPYRPM